MEIVKMKEEKIRRKKNKIFLFFLEDKLKMLFDININHINYN